MSTVFETVCRIERTHSRGSPCRPPATCSSGSRREACSCGAGGDRQGPTVREPLLDLGERGQPVLLEHEVGVVPVGVVARAGGELAALRMCERVARLEARNELLDVRP